MLPTLSKVHGINNPGRQTLQAVNRLALGMLSQTHKE